MTMSLFFLIKKQKEKCLHRNLFFPFLIKKIYYMKMVGEINFCCDSSSRFVTVSYINLYLCLCLDKNYSPVSNLTLTRVNLGKIELITKCARMSYSYSISSIFCTNSCRDEFKVGDKKYAGVVGNTGVVTRRIQNS